MTALPESVHHEQDLLYFASPEDPLLWYLVPGNPAPDTGRGAPVLQTMGPQTNLMLAARWLVATGDELAALADVIGRRHGAAGAVRVQPAPPPFLQIGGMALALADANGTPQRLADSTTSGIVPWDAVFSVMLDAPAAAQARAALDDGRPDLLTLTVRYALILPMSAIVRISGQVPAPDAALLARLAGHDDPDAADELLAAALRSGALSQDVLTALAPDAPQVRAASQQALDQARMLIALDLQGQVSAWRAWSSAATGDSKGAASSGGWISKTFGARHRPADPPPFVARPLALDVSSSESANVRFPAQQTDAGQSWLSATTDLGAWAARRRATHQGA